jgi:hypothetical protein
LSEKFKTIKDLISLFNGLDNKFTIGGPPDNNKNLNEDKDEISSISFLDVHCTSKLPEGDNGDTFSQERLPNTVYKPGQAEVDKGKSYVGTETTVSSLDLPFTIQDEQDKGLNSEVIGESSAGKERGKGKEILQESEIKEDETLSSLEKK